VTRPSDWDSVFGISDPTPGDPWSIRRMQRSWSDLADDAEAAESKLRQLLGDAAISGWIGEGGDAFRQKTYDLPGQLGKCHNSYRLAADALSTWATRLETHQADADRALVQGRAAKADLDAASASVTSASGSDVLAFLERYADTQPPASVQVPSDQQIRDARARLSSAQGAQHGAQSRLDAARQLALDAGSLREEDGRTAARQIREASDAGIPERSRWEKFKDWAADAWDIIVEICKIVVLVLGVVALIIGGPLAWVVFAAALLVLADTIMKYLKGEASLWDVALAALSCIPCTKGLTTLSELSAAFRSGGMLGAGAHLLSAGKTALAEMAQGLRALAARGAEGYSGLVMRMRVTFHSLRGGEFTAEGNMILRRWTPADLPGPLGTGYPANTFRSASYDEVVVVADQTGYRAVTSGSNLNGGFWSLEQPAGPLQTQLDMALLPEWQTTSIPGGVVTNPQATHYVEATIPQGSTIYQGPAGVQVGDKIPSSVMMGGGEQVYIPDMPADWLPPGVARVGG